MLVKNTVLRMKNEILNTGLKLAMEFGENWLQPIQDRLSKEYPELTRKELNEYNQICQHVMKFGHTLAVEAKTGNRINNPIFEKDKKDQEKAELEFKKRRNEFPSKVREKYEWVDDENLSKLFSQGCYYAMK